MNFEKHYFTEREDFLEDITKSLNEDKNFDPIFIQKIIQYFEKSFPSFSNFDTALGSELRNYVGTDSKKVKMMKKRLHRIVTTAKTKFLSDIRNKVERTINPETRMSGIKPAEEHQASKDMKGPTNITSDAIKKETEYAINNTTTNSNVVER